MKSILLVWILTFGYSTYADDATPTGDFVQFDVIIRLQICTLDSKYEIVQCNSSDNPTPIRETMKAQLMHSECTPKCTYNDSAEFSKSYTLKDPASGNEASVDLNVWFSRSSEIFDDTIPAYDLEVSLSPANGSRLDKRSALTSVRDLAALRNVFVDSKRDIKKLPNGNTIETVPTVDIVRVQIVK